MPERKVLGVCSGGFNGTNSSFGENASAQIKNHREHGTSAIYFTIFARKEEKMKKEDCFYLGRIAKTHGIKGEVTIKIDADDPSAYLDMKYFYLEYNKVLTPFFVEKLILTGDKFFATIQDVKTLEAAQNYVGKSVYLPLEMLPKLSGKQFYFHEVIGFALIDAEKGDLGPIKEILEYPTQAIIQVIKDGKEILIPVLDEVIQKVDRKEKKLYVKAPEGLIDMYLG